MLNNKAFLGFSVAAALLFMFQSTSTGQIEVEMRLSPRRALLHESVVAELRIANNSNQPVRFAGPEANARISFDISEMNGRTVALRPGRAVLNNPVVVAPFTTAELKLDLVSSHMIVKALPYKIRCRIDLEGRSFFSNQLYFDVLPGTAISSKTIRFNGRTRTYLLRYLYRDNHAEIFLRVENEDGSICYGVYKFGNYIRIQDAEMDFDHGGRIHLLFQSGPRRFSHYILTEDGRAEERKFYSGIAGRIKLSRSSGGEVSVIGGEVYAGDEYSPTYDFRHNRILE